MTITGIAFHLLKMKALRALLMFAWWKLNVPIGNYSNISNSMNYKSKIIEIGFFMHKWEVLRTLIAESACRRKRMDFRGPVAFGTAVPAAPPGTR